MKIFKNKYRIVTDMYAGFEVQYWKWWFPFWIQLSDVRFLCNTFPSIEQAKYFIERHKAREIPFKSKVVYIDDGIEE